MEMWQYDLSQSSKPILAKLTDSTNSFLNLGKVFNAGTIISGALTAVELDGQNKQIGRMSSSSLN